MVQEVADDSAHMSEKALERQLRTCAECGHVAETMTEYHPTLSVCS